MDVSKLEAGDNHYMAYVGPPTQFDYNSGFESGVFSRHFDFIVAQSIFSHTGGDLIKTALRNFKSSLKPDGLIIATFVEGKTDFDGQGWVYPDCVCFRRSTVGQF